MFDWGSRFLQRIFRVSIPENLVASARRWTEFRVMEFDHYVKSYQILPPVGSYTWAARANVKKVGIGRYEDFTVLKEHFGTTEREARAKAETELKAWIAKRTRSR